jgi:DNA-binding CsgD family transcriptional regulator
VLSQRELEVLGLVGQALSNRQIASQLSITEGTVKRHLRNVFAKLEATSRLDAVNRSVAAGLIPAGTRYPGHGTGITGRFGRPAQPGWYAGPAMPGSAARPQHHAS